MKIWDNDKKEFEEDLPTNLETGLSVNDFMSCHQTAHTNCHQIA